MKTKEIRTALIVGGGSGMGRSAAMALGRMGILVFVADLHLAAARETLSNIEVPAARGAAFSVNISESDAVAGLFEELKNETARLDLLVHTAAVLGRTVFVEEMTDEEWRQMMGVNLDGMFYVCREAVRWMKDHKTGRIILFSSVASLTPTPGALHYSASKGGVNMLGKTLAKEAARHNIRVNVVAPGYIETPMLSGLPGGFSDYVIKKTPLKRLGEPEEIGSLVAYLASPEADFMTGQVLSPNGGFVI
ncbi:MAG: SDR family oxidoreductase [Deltaproteobacteria bacterium]|nr:SDR family oxidoreductase [Deltaproteobacteria bacterium]